MAELPEALLEKTSSANRLCGLGECQHTQDDEVEAVVRGAAGRLILLYLPTIAYGSTHYRNALATLSPRGAAHC